MRRLSELQQNDQRMMNIQFPVCSVTEFANVQGDFSHPIGQNKESFLRKIKGITPTHIVLHYKHGQEPSDLVLDPNGQPKDLNCIWETVIDAIDDKEMNRLDKLLII